MGANYLDRTGWDKAITVMMVNTGEDTYDHISALKPL